MSERTKKQLIAILLLISCIISGWLLFLSPPNETKSLHNLAQVDSLIQQTFSDFNISKKQVSSYSTRVDSNFSRRTHVISVPSGFSKTQLHAVLQQQFAPYQITLPAQVIFPDRDMQIQFDYKNTVIYTVRLQTDEHLKMERSYASIIIAFEGRPPGNLLKTLNSMGEPLAVASIQYPPLDKPDWWPEARAQYSPILFWPKVSNGNNMLAAHTSEIPPALQSANQSSSGITMLNFSTESIASLQENTPFSYIDVSQAIIFNDEMQQSEFNQTFRTFVQQSRSGRQPTAIIMGTEENVQWMREQLNIFKKSGLFLTDPSN